MRSSPNTSPKQNAPALEQNGPQKSLFTCLAAEKREPLRLEEVGCSSETLTVNAKTVDGIFLDEIFDPLPVHSLNLGVLSVQIWEWDCLIAQPAVHFTLSIPPDNRAISVVLRLRGGHQPGRKGKYVHLSRTLSLNMYLE